MQQILGQEVCWWNVEDLGFSALQSQGLKTLSYCMIGTSALCLIAVRLVTGRTHQIRDLEAGTLKKNRGFIVLYCDTSRPLIIQPAWSQTL